jgi:hypothetical protein
MEIRLKLLMNMNRGNLPEFEYQEIIEKIEKSKIVSRKIKKLGKRKMLVMQNQEIMLKRSQEIRTLRKAGEKLEKGGVKTEFSWKMVNEEKRITPEMKNLPRENQDCKILDRKMTNFYRIGKFKFPKPRLKFPIPDKKMLLMMNRRKKKPRSRSSSRSEANSTSATSSHNAYKKRSVVIKDKKVHHLKLKLKKVMRLIIAFEENLTQLLIDQNSSPTPPPTSSSSSSKPAKLQNFKGKLTKPQLQKLKQILRKNFLILSRNYSEVQSEFADNLAISMVLHASIKVELSTKLFLLAIRPANKNRNIDVRTIRKSKSYQLVKVMLKKAGKTGSIGECSREVFRVRNGEKMVLNKEVSLVE